ncbi:MAG: metallophosphoesterase [Cyclobacteriaceae bacterium]|nr:metallophosphoesterase [Cyclobacteriaceae bacterium]
MNFTPVFRFAVASDGHFGETGVDSERNYHNLVNWLLEEKKQRGLDMWFFNGDLIHDIVENLPKVRNYFDSVNVPYYVIRGNHDTVQDEDWEKFFGYKPNFEVRTHEILFLGSKTSDEKGNYHCADIDWLQKRLKSNLHQKLIFIFLHISQGGWTEQGIFCPEVINFLDQHPEITAVFHGHDHKEDHMRESKNTLFFFDGYIGSTWGLDYFGYRMVEIDKDYHVRTYQYNPAEKKIVNENHI